MPFSLVRKKKGKQTFRYTKEQENFVSGQKDVKSNIFLQVRLLFSCS